ncbi:hypothetical protein [Paenibacillus sp. L3-i20]|uniref:hypothetical protein n=1 Tax=Paenibacillus sp. L3-i20 TaxID=2905833 RepID=UPI001EDF4CFD|nr:hypothetical protein [Paenibacillus sp. L3-i20]GKU76542.1 hypothetical protein L3i20_v209390 [Paenibacillus sp. L3-i20]
MANKIGNFLLKAVAFPFSVLFSIIFEPSGNMAMFTRDIIKDKRYTSSTEIPAHQKQYL